MPDGLAGWVTQYSLAYFKRDGFQDVLGVPLDKWLNSQNFRAFYYYYLVILDLLHFLPSYSTVEPQTWHLFLKTPNPIWNLYLNLPPDHFSCVAITLHFSSCHVETTPSQTIPFLGYPSRNQVNKCFCSVCQVLGSGVFERRVWKEH